MGESITEGSHYTQQKTQIQDHRKLQLMKSNKENEDTCNKSRWTGEIDRSALLHMEFVLQYPVTQFLYICLYQSQEKWKMFSEPVFLQAKWYRTFRTQ